ncbi:MAG: sigma-70 family RNA polymerase sigma factor [Candidatus Brocadiia bacterium]
MDEASRRLWSRYKRHGDETARNELVVSHLPLVRYVLGRLPVSLPAGLGEEDLASAGVVALLGAIEDFDPERGVEFATFAVPRIRGAMYDELRAHDIVPRSVRQRAAAIEKACVELSRQGQPAPSVDEIASTAGLSARDVERTMTAVGVSSFLSLEGFCRSPHGGKEHKILEAAVDGAAASPLGAVMAKERREVLAQAIQALPEAERLVITLYYHNDLMLKEIAEVLSVTKSRVSQIHSRALFRLRAHIVAMVAAHAPGPEEAPS